MHALPCAVFEFTELKNSLPKSPDLNGANYSVWGIATDSMVTKF